MSNLNSRYRTSDFYLDNIDSKQLLAPRAITPAVGVMEYQVVAGDRLDLLALYYYDDCQLWWRIVDANPFFFNGDALIDPSRIGQTILIPGKD